MCADIHLGWNSWNVIIDPPPLQKPHAFAQYATAGVCLFMILAGSFFVSKTLRMVCTVTAVPQTLKSGGKDLFLRVESTPFLLGIRPKKIEIPCRSITASAKLFTPTKERSMAERVRERRQRQQEHEFLESRRLTLPFRQAAYWIRRGFNGLQELFFDQNYISLRLKGKIGTWKMDRNPAWALDSGRVFDGLVRHHIV